MKKLAVFSTVLVLLECMFWGAGNILINIILKTMPTFLCLAVRSLIAAFLFLSFFRQRIIQSFKIEQLIPCLLISSVSFGAAVCSMLALKYAPPATAGFLISLSLVFAPFFAYLITGSKINSKMLIPICIITVGLYFMCGGNVEFKLGFGEITGILCSVCYALLIVLSQKYLAGINAMTICFFQTAFTGILCLAISLLFEDYNIIFNMQKYNWYRIIFISVFSTFAALSFQNFALRYLSSTYVSVLFCTESIFSLFFAFIILGERLLLGESIGAILLLAGVISASFLNKIKESSILSQNPHKT